MARGWESKDVESQRELREAPEAAPRTKSDREQQRDALLLQRTRVLSSLQAACHPRYRAQLEESLAYLEARIRDLS
ncbi:MAG: hypothetical protein K7J46_04460 [Bryobacter sp.]|jgi:hypothetical protein|nr:hypothetical protein [Bryobacter sp. CoA8 C33]